MLIVHVHVHVKNDFIESFKQASRKCQKQLKRTWYCQV